MRTTWQFKLNRHDDQASDPATDGGKPADSKPAGDGKLPQFTGDFDPDRAARALASAREAEKAAKTQAQEAQAAAKEKEAQLTAVLKALGKNADGSDAPPDPEAIATEARQRVERAEALAFQKSVKFDVHQAATELGADPARLLDSMTFIDSLDDLAEAGTDPGSPEFTAAIKSKVAEALERNPAYKATTAGPTGPRPDPSQGRGGQAQPVDYRNASAEDVAKAMAKLGLRPRS